VVSAWYHGGIIFEVFFDTLIFSKTRAGIDYVNFSRLNFSWILVGGIIL